MMNLGSLCNHLIYAVTFVKTLASVLMFGKKRDWNLHKIFSTKNETVNWACMDSSSLKTAVKFPHVSASYQQVIEINTIFMLSHSYRIYYSLKC